MKVYCLSGLGVDQRVFQNIQSNGMELIHIDWIEPFSNESLEHYSKRLFESINVEDNYSLIGVSFGGMVAVEFAKIKKPKTLFLISTLQERSQLLWIYRIAGYLRLHKLLPVRILKKRNFLTTYFFSVKSKTNKKLLGEILNDTDSKFLRWALDAILNWKNSEKVDGITIHGSNDRILPLVRKVDYKIEGGGHFMIVNKAKEISWILEQEGA